ncbi:MAG: A/G-specific adenine glycosylase [Terrimicrobiaceae bacterium]
MNKNTFPAARLRKKLGEWFRRHARDLPWRRTADAYAIAVSEMMLQQTTVVAVIPYFERWMDRFPTVQALADAPSEEVFACWQGLGYYSRARNLHLAAQEICRSHDGIFPRDPEALRKLPGFGPYTSGAVAAFAFDVPSVVIDANIARVLARLANVREAIDKSRGRQQIERFAASLLPPKHGGRQHTGALMELGALLCKSGRPRCDQCPVREFCAAGEPETLPVKAARKPVERITERRGLFLRGDSVALVASEGPRWKGLWLLPEGNPDDGLLHIENYPITRYLIRMEVVELTRAPEGSTFFSLKNLPPMPSPHTRAVAAAVGTVHSGNRVITD